MIAACESLQSKHFRSRFESCLREREVKASSTTSSENVEGGQVQAQALTKKRTKLRSAFLDPKPRKSKMPTRVSLPGGSCAMASSKRCTQSRLLSSNGNSPDSSPMHPIESQIGDGRWPYYTAMNICRIISCSLNLCRKT